MKGEIAIQLIVRAIRDAGLEIAAQKTEAIFFKKKGKRTPPPGLSFVVDTTRVTVRPHLKYLNLILDGTWNFSSHMVEAAARAGERAVTLGQIMPNLGGPDGSARRLYANMVSSVA